VTEIFMPRLSDTMEEGTISRWHKQPGDNIDKGEVIAEIETDKATMDLEAYDSGVLGEIIAPEGTTVLIGQPIALIENALPGTQPTIVAPVTTTATPPGAAETARPSPAAPPAVLPGGPVTANPAPVKASPMARAVAREHGIDLAAIVGTGPGGRIVRIDVDAALNRPAATVEAVEAPAPPAASAVPLADRQPSPITPDDVEEIPLTTMRKLVARRLTESMQNAPHFYLTTVINADPLVAFRAELNGRLARTEPPVKLSVNDLVIKACATALRANPAINVSFVGDKLLKYSRISIGVAVAVKGGLIVPVIRDADTKSVTQIAIEGKALIAKARAGKLTPDEFSGGTFTVSNLGMYGISHFTAVINPPEAAILAVGGTAPEPAVRDGEIVIQSTMRVTLSIDHRAVDGATGAEFLQQLKDILEDPLRIVA
jgi:pyruvate dehydrogenase E2 component (dihydrolipoamide acetyltransferase)